MKKEWLDTLKWSLAVVFASGVAFASIAGTAKDVEDLGRVVDSVKRHLGTHDVALAEVRNDVKHIKEGVDELLRKERGRR